MGAVINVEALDAHDPALFHAWYAAYHEGDAAGRHAPVVFPESVMLDQLTQESRAVRRAFGVFVGSECLGAAVLEWETEQNAHLGNIEVYVPPRHRRSGIGTALLERLSQEADGAGLTTLIAEVNAVTPEAAGLHFARRAGFSTVLTEDHQVLDLQVPEERLAQWRSVSDAPALGYAAHSWHGATPPDRLGQMAAVQNAMNADVPTGDMDVDPQNLTVEELVAQDGRLARRGYVTFVTLLTAPDGEPVGFTRIYIQTSDPDHALQDDTWVHVEHRGHRMGAWLKAENLALVQAAAPEARFLHTSNAQSNDAILSLNKRFGFRRTEVLHEVQRGGRT
ncbi:GNAT family N-acetyltransferase [Tessaracoccus antarcticus]|nr:GNAT family N-acetyltransferase [Tessaracoccus antarcticus]